MERELIEIGRIVNTHGIKGELKLLPHEESPEDLRGLSALFVDGRERKIRSARVHKGALLVTLEGVEDVNAAMRYKGRRVFIDRADAPLPEGGYFIQDIIGARVVSESGGEIGVLAEVIDAPAGMVYVVRGETEHLIPAVPEFILAADADAGIITARLIEGM